MSVPQRPGVSVCMATYNGADWVGAQLESILDQLSDDDEVVIVDDASTDGTAEVIDAIGDPRIRLERAQINRGYVRSFERALQSARGDVLLLSDQDDLWVPGRVARMVEALQEAEIVAGNLVLLDSGTPLRLSFRHGIDDRPRWNEVVILSGLSGYYGCAMGMRRSALRVLLPFPTWLIESHDLFLATAGNAMGSIRHLTDPVTRRRVHGGNATPIRPRSIPKVLRARIMLVKSYLVLRRRIARVRRR